jgi:hypothetical protein
MVEIPSWTPTADHTGALGFVDRHSLENTSTVGRKNPQIAQMTQRKKKKVTVQPNDSDAKMSLNSQEFSRFAVSMQ